jgi:2-dehydropantoate 2-reductase
MGMTVTNMAVVKPGYVSLQLNGSTVVGPSRDGVNHDASRKSRNLLRLSGLKVVEHPNVQGVRYNKLAVNALGYSSCLSASNFIAEAVCHQPWRDCVGRPLLEECLEVFRRARIRLSRIPGGTDIFRIRRSFGMLDKPLLGPAVRFFAKKIYDRNPIVFSLLQDLQRNKKTEVDFVNGQLVRLARAAGYDAPFNDLVVRSVYQLESRTDATLFSQAEVLRRFQAIGTQPRLRIAG